LGVRVPTAAGAAATPPSPWRRSVSLVQQQQQSQVGPTLSINLWSRPRPQIAIETRARRSGPESAARCLSLSLSLASQHARCKLTAGGTEAHDPRGDFGRRRPLPASWSGEKLEAPVCGKTHIQKVPRAAPL